VPVKAIRFTIAFAAIACVAPGLTGELHAAPPSGTNTTPQTQTPPAAAPDTKTETETKPAGKPDKSVKPGHKPDAHKSEAHAPDAHKSDKAAKSAAKSEKSVDSAHKPEKPAKGTTAAKTTAAKTTAAKTAPGPMMLAVPPGSVTSTASVPPPGATVNNGADERRY
jgi:hypothetical protein